MSREARRVAGGACGDHAVLARVSKFPHVAGVISPYSSRGALQVSPNRMTAFAAIDYDKSANLLPNNAGKPVLDGSRRYKCRG